MLANAIDLIAPIQTRVLAAAYDGTITYVFLGGADTLFWNYSNFIVIRHANREYTRYDHLAFSSSKGGPFPPPPPTNNILIICISGLRLIDVVCAMLLSKFSNKFDLPRKLVGGMWVFASVPKSYMLYKSRQKS